MATLYYRSLPLIAATTLGACNLYVTLAEAPVADGGGVNVDAGYGGPVDGPYAADAPPHSIDAGTAVAVLATGQDDPRHMVVDANYVYWVNHGTEVFGDGTVMRVAKSGGAPQILAENQNVPEGLVVDDRSLYWTNRGYNNGEGQVLRMDKTGGTPVVMVSGLSDPVELVSDANHLYWTNWSNYDVYRILKLGGPRELIANLGSQVMNGIAVDDQHAYFGTTAEFNVVSVANAGGGTPLLLGPAGNTAQTYLAVDDIYVYWTKPSSGSVMRAKKTGGTAVALFTGMYELRYLTVVDGTVYFAHYGAGTPGGIRKIARTGGDITTIHEGGSGYWDVAVDEKMVYFTNQSAGTINAAPR